ncbi:MAG: hypothetical protein LAO21_18990 [Acidobacteriia bacterium]|nr:hypothetical protein [Terriglobia bacterium]
MNALEKSQSGSVASAVPIAPARAGDPAAVPLPALRPSLGAPRFSLGQLYVAWESMKPQEGLYLIYGEAYVLELTQKILSRPLITRTPVILVDGNNGFNLYLYTRMARHFARRPEEFLRLMKISRAFTCHQMVSLAERVQKTAEKYHSPLVVALDPLATFYDENVPLFEANKLFKKFESTLRDLARRGLKVLLACPQPAVKQRSQYLEALKRDAIFRLACEQHTPMEMVLRLEQPEEFKQTWTLNAAPVGPMRYSRQLRLFQ